MTLAEFLAEERLSPSEFARRVGVFPSSVTRILNGSRDIGPKFAIRIEAATGGRVSRSDLRPDLWPPAHGAGHGAAAPPAQSEPSAMVKGEAA